jgi:hypothetical protein
MRGTTMADQLRIVVGSDDAGFDYKEILKKDLAENNGVVSVVDVEVDANGPTPASPSPPPRWWPAARPTARS